MMQALSVQARLKLAAPRLDAINELANKPDAQIVGLRDDFYQILEDYELSWKQHFKSNQVGTHPWNRYTTGVDTSEILTKIKNTVKSGFSMVECSRATSTERQPGPVGDAYEQFNADLATSSDGQLMPVQPNSLKLFSLTVGHTNQAIRAADHGVPSDDMDISRNGRVSKALLSEKDHRWKKALEEGLEWRVIRWEVEAAYPDLITMVIEADKVPNAIAKVDSPWHLLWKCHTTAYKLANGSNDADVDWDKVHAIVARSEFVRQDEIKDIIAFVRKWSGDGIKDPWIMSEIDAYIKTLKVTKYAPGVILGKLADMDLGPSIGGCFRAACLKAMASISDPKHVSPNGDSKFIGLADCLGFAGRLKPLVIQADDIMQRTRKIADADNVLDKISKTKLVGICDVRLVGHVLQRSTGFGVFKSMVDIAATFWSDYSKLVGGKTVAECPPAWRSKIEHVESKHGTSSGVANVSREGAGSLQSLLQILKSRDCENGSKMLSRDENEEFTVKDITIDFITLAHSNKGIDVAVSINEVFDKYMVKKTIETTILETWDYSMSNNGEFILDMKMSELKTALGKAHEANVAMLVSLSVVTAPSNERKVIAMDKIGVKKCVLTPLSTNIGFTKKNTDKVPNGSIDAHIAVKKAGVDCKVFINPKIVIDEGEKQVIVPFWFVSHSPDPAQVNCEVQVVEVNGLNITTIVNVKALKKGDVLTLLRKGDGNKFMNYNLEPPKKKRRH